MTSSPDQYEQARQIVAEITAQLDEALLVRTIDEPIDRAVATFETRVGQAISHAQLHETLARFVCHIHRYAAPCPRRLSLAQGRDEAVSLLEHGYEGICGKGYDAACLESRCGGADALERVLFGLAEAIKASRRRMYVRAVFGRWIDPSDWRLRCQIASVLLARYQAWLPPVMQGRCPSEFADDIPAFVDAFSGVDQLLQRIPAGSMLFRG